MRSSIFILLAGVLVMGASAQSARAQSDGQQNIQVMPLDEKGLKALFNKRDGRPLMVNVWATWCAPCIEEFPALVKIDSVYRRRGLDVATISIDYEDEVVPKVVPFLKRQGVRMPSYINAFRNPSLLIDAIDSSWSGAVPATFFLDESGRLVRSAIGKHSFEEFSRWVEDLIAQKRPRR